MILNDNIEVNISKKLYEELLAGSKWAAALEAAGVDNWDGYDEARRIYQENNDE